MKKKVGLVTCYFKHNYGSMLQAYATQKFLDDNHIPNETINIESNIDFKKGKRKYYLNQIFNFSFIKSKFGMIKLKFDKKINKALNKNITIRDKKYDAFKKKFHLTKPYRTYEELTNLCQERYCDVIVGSDQLWLPVNVVADYYTLSFVPTEVNKISYATSFGVATISKKYESRYRNFLNRFNHISVREEKGIELIQSITSQKAKLVCDPTLLLTKKDWDEIISPKRIIKDKYILCYFLGKNIEHRKFAEKLKQETGYLIVSLNHADEYVKYSDKFADIKPYNIGPSEWINLIQNAEYICTDSFHGTVFSLINNKKFYTFRRYKSNTKVSTNSRIDSLLRIVDLKERLLEGTEDIKEVIKLEIDYKAVNKKLSSFRNSSKKFLLNSLTYKGDKNEK